MRTRTVTIVLFDDVQSLDVTGPLEVFTGANGYWTDHPLPHHHSEPPRHNPSTPPAASPSPPTPTSTTPHSPHPARPRRPRRPQPQPRPRHLATPQRTPAHRVVSVCTGAFLLAAAGLLTGRTVTTHWERCQQLADQHPDLTVDPEPIYIHDGDITTSAGVTSGIDMALSLVEHDTDRDTALAIARQLVVFLRRPGNQTQFSTQLRAQTAHREPLRDIQQWITEHPDADLTIDELARRANLSPRQFARTFTAETGATPGHYVDQTRLETARRLLEDTTHAIEHVARHSGYGTPEAMRRAFHNALGVSPAEYRRRF